MYPCRSWLWQGYFYVAIVTFLSLLSVPSLIAIIAPVLTGLVLGCVWSAGTFDWRLEQRLCTGYFYG